MASEAGVRQELANINSNSNSQRDSGTFCTYKLRTGCLPIKKQNSFLMVIWKVITKGVGNVKQSNDGWWGTKDYQQGGAITPTAEGTKGGIWLLKASQCFLCRPSCPEGAVGTEVHRWRCKAKEGGKKYPDSILCSRRPFIPMPPTGQTNIEVEGCRIGNSGK